MHPLKWQKIQHARYTVLCPTRLKSIIFHSIRCVNFLSGEAHISNIVLRMNINRSINNMFMFSCLCIAHAVNSRIDERWFGLGARLSAWTNPISWSWNLDGEWQNDDGRPMALCYVNILHLSISLALCLSPSFSNQTAHSEHSPSVEAHFAVNSEIPSNNNGKKRIENKMAAEA